MSQQLRQEPTTLRLRALLNQIEQAVVSVDDGSGLAEANAAAVRLLGLESAELPAPVMLAALEELAGRAINRDATTTDAGDGPQLWRFSGAPTHLQVRCTALRQPGFSGRVWVLDDVSALMARNEYLEAANAAGIVGVWDWDVPANVLSWDPVMYRLYGRDPGDFGGAYEAWADAVHPDDRAYAEGEIQAALRGEREYAPRFRVIWPDGSVHHLQAVSHTTYDREGQPLRMLGVNYDLTEQVRITQELASQKALLDTVLGHIDAHVYMKDRQGRYVYVNPPVAAQFGRPIEQILGHTDRELLPPGEAEALTGGDTQVFDQGGTLTLEEHLRDPDGQERLFLSEKLLLQRPGQDDCLIGFSKDVTEARRRAAELEELRHRTERLALELTDHMPAGTYVVRFAADGTPVFEFASRRLLEMLGLELEPVKANGNLPFQLLHPGDAPEARARLLEAYRQRQPFTWEGRLLVEHRPLWVSTEALPHSREDGSVVLEGVVIDVTRRKQAERELAEANALFRQSMQNAAVGQCLCRPGTGELLEVNPALCSFFRRDAETLLACSWQELTHPDDLEIDRALARELELGRLDTYRIRKRFLRPDGSLRWGDLSMSCIRNPDGSVRVMLAQISDITELIRSQEQLKEEQARLHTTIDSLIDPHLLLEPVRDVLGLIVDLRILEANRASLVELGRTREKLLGRTLLAVLPGIAATGLLDLARQAIEGGQGISLDEFHYPEHELADGDVYLDVRMVQVAGNLSFTWRDVSERRRAAEQLARSEQDYRLLALNMLDVVMRMAEDGTVLWVSPSLTAMLGWTPEEWIGQNGTRFLVDGPDSETYRSNLQRLQRGESVVARDRVYAKGGSIHWVESHLSSYRRSDGTVDGLVSTFRTVDLEVIAEQQLQQEANFDVLTGLLNRREMLERLSRFSGSRRQGEGRAALLFCDLDHFKQINDQHGHLAGDQVLRTQAERLRRCIRDDDLAARMGGDELVVALMGVGGMADALAIAEKIRRAAAEPIPVLGERVSSSLSIGVTLIESGEDVDALIARADTGLYAAKQQGRNRVIPIEA
jgi:diguanylate cyclase (GGDEF)-like protein/PAS domain S-box-containing protein